MPEPIYSARAEKIIEMLRFQTREEAAKELRYKSWKGLDMYMRRKNFVYDSGQGQYIPATSRRKKEDYRNSALGRVLRIIDAFNGGGPDPREIAEDEGFTDHREMAEYMKAKGFEWSVYKNNYVKIKGFKDEIGPSLQVLSTGQQGTGVDGFLPFIQFLYERRERVYQLLDGVEQDGKIPRYAIPGLVRIKAIYMSDMVARLTGKFSKEKNITQREIVEAALVEYLRKYGFKREVDALLNNM